MKNYPMIMEVSGEFGMFPDPSTGGNSTSFPIPPSSSCVGMFESVFRIPGVRIDVQAVALCCEIEYQSFDYNNSSGSGRKQNLVKEQNTWQLAGSVLRKPVFQIVAQAANDYVKSVKRNNNAHCMQDRFMRRVKKRQNFRTPTLGRREFIVDYFGEPRTPINTSVSLEIASFPFGSQFDKDGVQFSKLNIQNGIAIYQDGYVPSVDENGCLSLG